MKGESLGTEASHSEQLHVLSEVIDAIARSADSPQGLESIYAVALNGLQRALGVERGAIVLFSSEGGGAMSFKAWLGISDSYRQAIEKRIRGPQNAILPPHFVVPDIRNDPFLTELIPVFEKEEIRALAFIPLIYGGQMLGRFVLYSRVPYHFEKEMEFGLTLGRSIAFAIVRKQAEEELRQAKCEAEKSVQLRDDFLSVASHELNTPLTALKMQLQTIPKIVQKVPFQEKETFLSLFQYSLKQLDQFSRLVDELLDVSRIRAGRLIVNRQRVTLSDLIERIIEQYRKELSEVGCSVTAQVASSIRGYWDMIRIEQVIVNLLSNAMKYGAGQPIEISAQVVGHWVRLKIQDHGIGIAKEDQSKIFDRFERVAPITGYRGLGLGLYITRQIVEAHGGTIQVESETGKGSAFTVVLPGEQSGA